MVVCIILYIVLLVSRLWKRKKKILDYYSGEMLVLEKHILRHVLPMH